MGNINKIPYTKRILQSLIFSLSVANFLIQSITREGRLTVTKFYSNVLAIKSSPSTNKAQMIEEWDTNETAAKKPRDKYGVTEWSLIDELLLSMIA